MIGASCCSCRRGGRGRKKMPQENVDERRAAGADFAAAAAGLVPQAQPVVFDLEKLLVEREQVGSAGCGVGPSSRRACSSTFS